MADDPGFDVAAAHRFFSAHCFNQAWDLIDKPNRTAAEDRLMVALSLASLYHWLSRPDCEPRHLSVGYWQASRIQSLLGNSGEARRYAENCMEHSGGLEPFYRGYAHEAMARAATISGDAALAARHLAHAREQAALVASAEDRDLLRKDLAGLE